MGLFRVAIGALPLHFRAVLGAFVGKMCCAARCDAAVERQDAVAELLEAAEEAGASGGGGLGAAASGVACIPKVRVRGCRGQGSEGRVQVQVEGLSGVRSSGLGARSRSRN